MTATPSPFPYDLAQSQAQALLGALTANRETVLRGMTLRLAQRPELRPRLPTQDDARRLAQVLYGNFVAALTFSTYAAFERDIAWHRNVPVTHNHEREMFRGGAEAMSLELPQFTREINAICMSVIFLVQRVRSSDPPADASLTG